MKGFIFSIDVLFAITIVILAAALLFSIQYNEINEEFELVKLKAFDKAKTGFLFNSTEETIIGNTNNAYCFSVFNYNPNNSISKQSILTTKQFCSWIQGNELK